ncbi:hypothetical protein CDAR_31401 [Caerostris darwini]|uniref:NADH dehydrogenase [ubiquinone] 1 alpha subcomplex subunit 12 n=1 Tax=Caerostris darwini TaxID=1538125 RepID=A0AAV4SX13_9ARAC|nr:hypothetical protein CDAR_31401 [Caerostris darwini]
MLSKKRKLFQRCGMSGCMEKNLLNHSFSTRNSIMCYRNYVVEEKETLPKVWHEWLHGEEPSEPFLFNTKFYYVLSKLCCRRKGNSSKGVA